MKIRSFFFFIALILILKITNATDLYWIGNNGNWSNTNNWSNTSGGSPCGCVPTQSDNVFFDANSFSNSSQTVTVDQTAYCKSMNWTGASNAPTLGGGYGLNIYGSLTLNSTMNLLASSFSFKASNTGNTIQSFGKVLSYVYFEGAGGGWTLQDNLTTSYINFATGTLNTNNVTVTTNIFTSTGSGIRSLLLGSSTISVSHNSYSPYAWEVSGGNVTVNAGTSTINLTGSPYAYFNASGAFTYYDVNFTNTAATQMNLTGGANFHNVTFAGSGSISGNNTFNNLSLGTSATTNISGIQTINGTFTCNGTCTTPASLNNGTINKASGTVTINYVRLQNVTATGGANFVANNITDLGANNGWYINSDPSQNLHWVGNGGNWTDPNHWSFTSGGTSSGCIPTLEDNVFFDAGSFNSGGQTVSIDQTAYCKSMNWTGASNAPTLGGGYGLNIYGSLTLNSTMNLLASSFSFKASNTGNTIQSFGKVLSYVYFEGAGGGWTLQDNLTTSYINFATGTLNTNNVTVTTNIFTSTGSGIRSLLLGSSTISVSHNSYSPYAWEVSGGNVTVNAGTSTINLTGSPYAYFNASGAFTYYDVNFTNTAATQMNLTGGANFHNVTFAGSGSISGNNTFNNLSPGTSATTNISGIQTINGTFTCNGTCGIPASLNNGTINKTSGTVTINYVRLQNVIATGGATFTANNVTDFGGNNGWTLNTPSSQNLHWVGNGGNWTDPNHWSFTSGGTSSGCIPSPYDNVFFDAGSFNSGGQTVSIDQTAYCKSMNWTGASNAPTLGGGYGLNIYGSLTLNSTMNLLASSFSFKASNTGNTIQSFGKVLSYVYFEGAGGGWTLQDNLTTSYINFATGTLNTNNVTVTTNIFTSTGSGIRSLLLGSSTISVSHNSYSPYAWEVSGGNVTVNAGTSTINLTGSPYAYFNAYNFNYYDINFTNATATQANLTGGSTFHNVAFAGSGSISGNNTFNNLSLGTSATTNISGIQTINGTFTCNGTIGNFASMNGGFVHKSSGSVCVNYVNLNNITATGGANFYAGNSQVSGTTSGWILQSCLSVNYPQIFLDKAQIYYGQSDLISGKYFTPNGQVKIAISSQAEQTNIVDTLFTTTNLGHFNFIYSFISNLPAGLYNILATDQTTLQSSYLVRLTVLPVTPTINRNIKIISPITNTSSSINSSITISWSDRPHNLNNLIPNTSRINVSYKVEYNKDNTGWHLITIKNSIAEYQQPKSFEHSYTPAQSGIYEFRVTDVFDQLNKDISAAVTVGNYVSGSIINYEWDYSGNRPTNKKPMGIAADGTARIYVKILKRPGNTKTISNVAINATDPQYPSITESRLLGKLKIATDTSSYSIQANTASMTNSNSSTSGLGNIFWFWYVAPDDFVRNTNDDYETERILRLSATVTYSDNTSEPISRDIIIVRPPLMLVHGWGGAESSWDNFYFGSTLNKKFYKSDPLWKNTNQRAVTMDPIGSFAANARSLLNLKANGDFNTSKDLNENYAHNSFQYFLKIMRDQGYSSNRVDYVGHSMGGCMARTATNLYSTKYKPLVSDPPKFKNYENGFINKLITLNTPHNGSPWADFFINNANSDQLYYILQNAYIFGDKLWDRQLFLDMFYPLEGTPFLNLSLPTEAFKNLRHGSEGVKFTQTTVKNHLIAGDIINDVALCTTTLNSLTDEVGLGLFSKIFRRYNLKTCQEIDNFFNQYGITDFITDGDVVVHLKSQLPGKNISGSGTDYTIFYGNNSFHTTVRNSNKNLPVSLKTFQLLNSPIGNNMFANTMAANSSSGSIVYRNIQNTTLNKNYYTDTTKITIENPGRMSVIKVDSTLSIDIRLKDTVNHKYTSILFQGEVNNTTTKTNNQSFIVQITPLYPGVQKIFATAVYDSSGTDIYYSDTLSVNAIKDTNIVNFIVSPETKHLLSDQKYIPNYFLVHNNYVTNVSIADTALHIVISDTSVISFSNSGKFFHAKDNGSTYAVVSYKQFKDTIYLIITSPLEENIIPQCSQGNISFFNGIIDSTKNYQWQVDTSGGFYNILPSTIYSGLDSSTLVLTNPPTNWYNYKYRCIISDSIGSTHSETFVLKFANTWMGLTDSAWENAGNWSCNSLPDRNTDVIINSSVPYLPQINSNVECRSLTLRQGSSVIVKTGFRIDILGIQQ